TPRHRSGRSVDLSSPHHASPRRMYGHALSDALEGPLEDAVRKTPSAEALERATVLPELRKTAAGFVWAGRDYPAARVSLRSASPDPVLVVESDSGSVLGTLERERAYSAAHEGAVYLHLGEQYLVQSLDLETGTALVDQFTGDWYTQAKKETMTTIEAAAR